MAQDAERLPSGMVQNASAQQQAGLIVRQGEFVRSVKRDEYANHIIIERREHDAVLRFKLQGEDYSTLVREITVPLGALEGLA